MTKEFQSFKEFQLKIDLKLLRAVDMTKEFQEFQKVEILEFQAPFPFGISQAC